MDVAVIGLKAVSKPIEQASQKLDEFSAASNRADAANTKRQKSDAAAAASTGANARASRDATAATAGLSSATVAHTTRLVTNTGAVKANNAALVAQAAVSKQTAYQSRMLAVQLGDVAQSLALGIPPMQVLLQQGPQITGMYGGIGASLRAVGGYALNLVRTFPLVTAAVVAGTAAFGLMTREINKTAGVSVGLGDTMLATFQVIRDGVWSYIGPAAQQIGNVFGTALDWVIGRVKATGNTIINTFVGAARAVSAVWQEIPGILGEAAYGAANAVIAGVNQLVSGSIAGINALIGAANMIPGVEIGMATAPQLSSLENPYAGSASAGIRGAASALVDQFGQDPLGALFDSIKAQAIQNALAGVESTAKKAGKALKTAAETGRDAWDGLRGKVAETAKEAAAAVSELGQGIGNTLKGLLDGTTSWKDALISGLQMALKYLNQLNVAGGGKGLFGGGFFQSLLGGLLGVQFAKGGVFGPHGVTAFAKGGVVNKPTVFPFAKGAGLMGEAGPEAIMPLKRGPNGALGVQMVNDNRRPAQQMAQRVEVVPSKYFDVHVTQIADTSAGRATGALAQRVPAIAMGAMNDSQTRGVQQFRKF